LTPITLSCRREFYGSYDSVPQANYVIEQYARIWQHNTHCDEVGLDPVARQRYRQEHSLSVMEELRAKCVHWIEQTDEIEPNSGFGQACQYFVNQFAGLSLFCHVPGAKLDNNGVEQTLKLVIRIRKNSLF